MSSMNVISPCYVFIAVWDNGVRLPRTRTEPGGIRSSPQVDTYSLIGSLWGQWFNSTNYTVTQPHLLVHKDIIKCLVTSLMKSRHTSSETVSFLSVYPPIKSGRKHSVLQPLTSHRKYPTSYTGVQPGDFPQTSPLGISIQIKKHSNTSPLKCPHFSFRSPTPAKNNPL